MPNRDEIAPYTDADVPIVLGRLLQDPALIDAVGRLWLKGWYGWVRPFAGAQIRKRLQAAAAEIHTIHDFQIALEPLLANILKRTTETFTVSGLQALDPSQSYVFLSNHRDIAMDPAFVNWALHHGGFETVRIAIGDNLIKKPFVGDLMRLNKSFIVKRSVSGPREMLKTYTGLSNYIRDSIDQGHSVWIAHREGRAKDGIDQTDPAILKMLAMAGKARGESAAEALTALHIIPVSISYEFDPCAGSKARELTLTESQGHYQKAPDEDVTSIARGITGWKGRVHLDFGTPLVVDIDHMPVLADRIDQAIVSGQRIFDTNRAADSLLKGEPLADELLPDVIRRFRQILDHTPAAYRTKLLEIYANPLRQLALHQQRQLETV